MIKFIMKQKCKKQVGAYSHHKISRLQIFCINQTNDRKEIGLKKKKKVLMNLACLCALTLLTLLTTKSAWR